MAGAGQANRSIQEQSQDLVDQNAANRQLKLPMRNT